MTGTRAQPAMPPTSSSGPGERTASARLRSAGRKGIQEALTGFDPIVLRTMNRAVKASPTGGLRPALTALVVNGPNVRVGFAALGHDCAGLVEPAKLPNEPTLRAGAT